MRPLTPYNEFWLDHNGRTVVLQGVEYLIKASCLLSYPTQIRVTAEYTDKSLPSYRRIKRELGDDWDIDLLQVDVERATEFRLALEAKYQQPCDLCGDPTDAALRLTALGLMRIHNNCNDGAAIRPATEGVK